MNSMLSGGVFAAALLCAAAMGFAIQRGGTCTVAAMDDLIRQRSPSRLLSLLEASLWVGVGLLVAQRVGALPAGLKGYALSGATLAGALLLGLGAVVNGACILGGIARLGSGQWAYAGTPIGFLIGCASVDTLFGSPMPQHLTGASVLLQVPDLVVPLLVLALLARAVVIVASSLRSAGVAGQRLPWSQRAWSPHTATIVIGLSFLLLLLLAGNWAYTDVLADVARGMSMANSVIARVLLAVALLAGAVFSGWRAGVLTRILPGAPAVMRCVAGGMLIGWGSLLIPGGNDALILIGLPLLWPYAWLSFATMCLVVAVALRIEGAWVQRTEKGAATQQTKG